VEVADDGDMNAEALEAIDNDGHGLGGIVVINGDADEFRSGACECRDLADSAVNIGGIGVGHRLNDDRGVAADAHTANESSDSFPATNLCHGELLV